MSYYSDIKTMEFTIDAYTALLMNIKVKKYNYIFYDEIGSHDREVIIRHDVDFSLEKALEMAILENQLKVKSSYFVLISSPFYNIHEKNSKQTIKKIIDLGHKIGLHFDHTVYNSNIISDIINYAIKEVELLSIATESNVNTISFHRPAKFLLDSNVCFHHGIINTYSKEFFNDIKYISDSRMSWRTNPFDALNEGNKKIQLLVHPFWYYKEEKNPSKIFSDFFTYKSKDIYFNMDSNFTNLKEFLRPFEVLMEEKNDKL